MALFQPGELVGVKWAVFLKNMSDVFTKIWVVVWNMLYVPIQLGMSSSQLTKSIIFQRGRWLNHQPVIGDTYDIYIYIWYYGDTMFRYIVNIAGWWFGTFFIIHNKWDIPSHWQIFSKMVKTTNQIDYALIFSDFPNVFPRTSGDCRVEVSVFLWWTP